MWAYPGKKTLFMGQEFGQYNEWNYETSLDWHLNQYPVHSGSQNLVKDLSHLYKNEKSLYHFDCENRGFQWIDCDDTDNSIVSFLRNSDEDYTIFIANFTPVIRKEYRIGVPEHAYYAEILNSDSEFYAGTNVGNGQIHSDQIPMHGFEYSVKVTLPPLAAIILKRK